MVLPCPAKGKKGEEKKKKQQVIEREVKEMMEKRDIAHSSGGWGGPISRIASLRTKKNTCFLSAEEKRKKNMASPYSAPILSEFREEAKKGNRILHFALPLVVEKGEEKEKKRPPTLSFYNGRGWWAAVRGKKRKPKGPLLTDRAVDEKRGKARRSAPSPRLPPRGKEKEEKKRKMRGPDV